MTNDEKLMQKALGALEEMGGGYSQNLIAALRERLAQQVQEPLAWANKDDLQNFDMRVRTNCDLMHTVPLYTAPPPQRQWVGLTDEEKSELDAEYGDDTLAHLDAIEAKLREKNTYETPSDSAA